MPHRNIPIFIPHLGCPNQCVFCNQRSISGCREFLEDHVGKDIAHALSTIPEGVETEIAFFGGSFTGIDRGLMIRLLDTAQSFVQAGRVSSIRLSTRPDYINNEILDILSRYSVKVIELGLQSMDNDVLKCTRRGHTKEQARDACRAVKATGFDLVGQMMIGLPGAMLESELATAREIVELGADAARIYPTVVFYDTPLCEMTQKGEYEPLSLEEAVRRSAAVLGIFEEAEIPCIRIGLCATEELASPEKVLAGPNHPALGELVWNEFYYQKLLRAVKQSLLRGGKAILHLPERKISKVVGQHRCNIERLMRETDVRICKIVGEKHLREVLVEQWQASQNQEEEQPCI